MTLETDSAFLKRILAEIDAQTAGGTELARVTLDVKDLERMLKLYKSIPPGALRTH